MKRRDGAIWPLVVGILALAVAFPLWAADTDGDGLPDDIEDELGTDPRFAETLQTVATSNPRSADHPELDIVRVEMGNVARNRWLWAFHAADPYTFANSGFILYWDTDNNPQTGRQGMGCEFMFSHTEGAPGLTAFAPDGSPGQGKSPRVALADGVLYMCVDTPVVQDNGKSKLRFTVLSETRQPHAAVSSTGWVTADGPADSDRPTREMAMELQGDRNFGVTEGLDLIWKLQADPRNVALQSPQAELQGFRYYDAEYRWHAVIGNGRITFTVPRAGRFYPALVVYDSRGREIYEMTVNGEVMGAFVAGEDDNRQRIHFLQEPVDFAEGDTVTVRTFGDGSHITEDLLLLSEKPPVRGRKFELSNLEATAVTRAGAPALRVTWITTWPSACTVEYRMGEEDARTVTEPKPQANHRVFLEELTAGASVEYRVIAPKLDGSELATEWARVTVSPPAPFDGAAELARAPITVANPYGCALKGFPVSNGIPFAKGELGNPDHARLLDSQGREIPMQAQATMRWLDGSIKWLLVTFLADLPANGHSDYSVEYGTRVRRMAVPAPVKVRQDGQQITVDTGLLRAQFDGTRSGCPTRLWFDADGDGQFADADEIGAEAMALKLAGAAGADFDTLHAPELVEIEEAGPLRVVVKLSGHHQNAEGKGFFTYRNRFVFHAGSPLVRMYTLWGNDEPGEFAEMEGLSLQLPTSPGEGARWTVGLGDGQIASGKGDMKLEQLRDDRFTLEPAGGDLPAKSRADGWVDVSNERWGLTAMVRDFWQTYPKGLRVTPDGLSVDLCPDFPEGTYDNETLLDDIKLYFYLKGGKYKLRQGMTKQHEVLLWFHPGTAPADAPQFAQALQDPPLALCSPERYCGTAVFGEILPATTGRWPDYEQVCEKVYNGYVSYRESNRNYGMLNFGDQFGERKVNWANGEYDHHHAFLMQFARCADPKWYRLGERAARHAIDVDTAHYGPYTGGEWIHSMGHTGRYFSQQYEGSGIPGSGFTPSHTWTEGFCDWFALSGDPTAAENAGLVADHYAGEYLCNYDFSNCRDNGWNLLLQMAAFRATGDPFYLNACRIIVERTLERQSPGGGWHRQMVPGHCLDFPRHRGEANFMLGVLANGLEEFYNETGDERVALSIVGGARQAVAEMWVPEVDGFRYTSCPNMTGYVANNDMVAEILFFAYRLAGDPDHGEIAMRAMQAAFNGGIGSIAHLRWTPHILYNMDLLSREGPALSGEQAHSLLIHQKTAGPLDLWLGTVEPLPDDTAISKLAQLVTSSGQVVPFGDDGRLRIDKAEPGYHEVRILAGDVAWQFRSSNRDWVAKAGGALKLRLGKLPAVLRLHPEPGAADLTVVVAPQDGPMEAALELGDARAKGRCEAGQTCELKVAVADAVPATLTLRGPGTVRLSLLGAVPFVAISPGQFVNPGAPVVSIDGPQSLAPGQSRAKYAARVSDADGDVETIRWELPGGATAEGPDVEVEFAHAGAQILSVRVTDRAGNTADARIIVSAPPQELAGVTEDRVVTVQAEDFAGQGEGAVQLFQRIGCQGRMLSYWDESKGHWLEWDVPIAIAGDYRVYLRYCSGSATEPRRALLMDGASPGEAFEQMALPVTGGFCTQTDNWAYHAAGGGQAIALTAGTHRLRLTNLGGGVGLDSIVLVRQ